MYKHAGAAKKGIVIGHGNDPIREGHRGWQAFRMGGHPDPAKNQFTKGLQQWTEEINMAWIDGAVDAGKPILVATPVEKIRRGSVTWLEITRAINRGGKVVFLR